MKKINLLFLVAVAIFVSRMSFAQGNCEKFFFVSPQTTNAISNIWVMDTTGGNRHVLFADLYYRQALSVSSDGTMLAYSKRKDPIAGTSGGDSLWICTSAIDGSNEQERYLVPNYLNYEVRHTNISTDKTKIVFDTYDDGWPSLVRNGDLFSLDLPSATVTQLTSNSDTPKFYPGYSPDGLRIVYSQLGTAWYAFPWFLQTMNSNGTGIMQYSPLGPGAYQSPRYSPDGNKIVFTYSSAVSLPVSLYTMNADGTGVYGLGYTSNAAMQPVYNPGTSKIAFWDVSNTLRIVDAAGTLLTSIAPGTNTVFNDVNWVSLGYTPHIITSAASLCAGQSVTLSASGAGSGSYSWSPAAGLAATTGASIVCTPSGSLSYSVTGTDSNGCSGTSLANVTVYLLPVLSVIPAAPAICSGAAISMTAGGAATYAWSPATGLSVSTGATVTASPTGTITYTIFGTSVNGCVNTITATVTVLPVPSPPVVSSPVVYCQHDIAAALTAAGSGLLWYTTVTGGIGSPGPLTPSTSVADTITYYVSQTTGGCESARDSISVIIKPSPVIGVLPASGAVCAGGSIPLIATGGVGYSWAPAGSLSASTGTVVSATPLATTTYTVTGTGSNGCSDTASAVVVVHPLPLITVSPSPASVCIGSSVSLHALGAASYSWSPAATLSSSTGGNVVASPLVTTAYSITAADVYGCTGSATVTVNVYTIPSPPSVSSPVGYCQGAAPAALTAAGSGLLWYAVSSGGVGSLSAPVPSTAAPGSATWYVSQTVNGCESSRDSIVVLVDHNAEAAFDYVIKYGCIVDTVVFSNMSQYADSFAWRFDDGSGSTLASPVYYVHAVTGTANFNEVLYAHNPVCYADSVTLPVTILPSPQLVLTDVTPDQSVTYGSSIRLNAAGADYYIWTPADGSLNNPNINNPVATPAHDEIYVVYGHTLNGCTDSAEVHIKVLYTDSVFIPSAFTPNGDGENDLFHVINLKYCKLAEFRVYNRWGQVVFQASGGADGWDGTFNGVPQEMDTYQYIAVIVYPDGSMKQLQGDITLIR